MSQFANSNFVIFAAGVGSRLDAGRTKFLVEVNGRFMFDHQLTQLSDCGGCIYVVCGFQASEVADRVSTFVRQFGGQFPQICFVYNPDYEQSQVISIRRALECIPLDRQTFFIDGDMLFRRRAIEELSSLSTNAVLVRADITADAVIAETDGQRLVRFSRNGQGNREWANIAKYQPEVLPRLLQLASSSHARHHFDLINGLSESGTIVATIEGEVAEIDEPADIATASEFARGLGLTTEVSRRAA